MHCWQELKAILTRRKSSLGGGEGGGTSETEACDAALSLDCSLCLEQRQDGGSMAGITAVALTNRWFPDQFLCSVPTFINL